MSVSGKETVLPFLFLIWLIGTFMRNLLYFIPRNLRPPYTGLVFFFAFMLSWANHSLGDDGFGLGPILGISTRMIQQIDPEVILLIIIPPLVRGPGVILNAGLTALVGYYWIGISDWTIAMLFGSIMAATDPVSVVATLREIGVSQKIAVLIEGESLLNDGTSFVAALVFLNIADGNQRSLSETIGFLFQLTLGGPALGILMSFLLLVFLKVTYPEPTVQTTYILISIFAVFYISELLQVSSVLALVALGLIMSLRGKFALSPTVVEFNQSVIEEISYLSNTLIFGIAGAIVYFALFQKTTIGLSGLNWVYLLLLYVMIHVIRGGVIVLLYPIMRFQHYGFDWKIGTLLMWSGLRGSIGLSLASIALLRLPDNEYIQLIAFYVSGIVGLTIIVNGLTTEWLYNKLSLSVVEPSSIRLQESSLISVENEVSMLMEDLRNDWFYRDVNWEVVRSVVPNLTEGKIVNNEFRLKKSKLSALNSILRGKENTSDEEIGGRMMSIDNENNIDEERQNMVMLDQPAIQVTSDEIIVLPTGGGRQLPPLKTGRRPSDSRSDMSSPVPEIRTPSPPNIPGAVTTNSSASSFRGKGFESDQSFSSRDRRKSVFSGDSGRNIDSLASSLASAVQTRRASFTVPSMANPEPMAFLGAPGSSQKQDKSSKSGVTLDAFVANVATNRRLSSNPPPISKETSDNQNEKPKGIPPFSIISRADSFQKRIGEGLMHSDSLNNSKLSMIIGSPNLEMSAPHLELQGSPTMRLRRQASNVEANKQDSSGSVHQQPATGSTKETPKSQRIRRLSKHDSLPDSSTSLTQRLASGFYTSHNYVGSTGSIRKSNVNLGRSATFGSAFLASNMAANKMAIASRRPSNVLLPFFPQQASEESDRTEKVDVSRADLLHETMDLAHAVHKVYFNAIKSNYYHQYCAGELSDGVIFTLINAVNHGNEVVLDWNSDLHFKELEEAAKKGLDELEKYQNKGLSAEWEYVNSHLGIDDIRQEASILPIQKMLPFFFLHNFRTYERIAHSLMAIRGFIKAHATVLHNPIFSTVTAANMQDETFNLFLKHLHQQSRASCLLGHRLFHELYLDYPNVSKVITTTMAVFVLLSKKRELIEEYYGNGLLEEKTAADIMEIINLQISSLRRWRPFRLMCKERWVSKCSTEEELEDFLRRRHYRTMGDIFNSDHNITGSAESIKRFKSFSE